MDVRSLDNDLSLIESKIKSLRLILNLPLTQNRLPTNSEKENIKKVLEDIENIITKHKQAIV
jgi:hypothetical protein